MKKTLIATLVASAVAVTGAVVLITRLTPSPEPAQTSPQSSVSVRSEADGEPVPQQQNIEEQGYLLSEYDGRLAVYDFGAKQPRQVFDDIYIRLLPEYDQEELKKGIFVPDDNTLSRLLEDYTS